jgi:hypothetical protein
LQIIETHLTSNQPISTKKVNLLEKYKAMSNVDGKYILQFVNYEINDELTMKYESIIRNNKHLFE